MITKPMIGAIIQARMSSQRFPGKVLHEIEGKPILEYLLERLEHSSCLDRVVVATSTDNSDTPIVDYCEKLGVACSRGPLSNVSSRFNSVLETCQFDCFVRVSGDSPLLDPQLIDKAVNIFVNRDLDMVTNVQTRTYPKGQSVEILRADTFRNAYKLMHEDEDFEHVTRFFYKHPEAYQIYNFVSIKDLSSIQLSVDTQEDMKTFESIVSRMSGPHWEYHLQDVLQIYNNL